MNARAQAADRRDAGDDIARLRVPPHSIEAEQSVLGGLMLDNSAWDRAGDLLTDSDFYRYEHKAIYKAIGDLVSQTKPADVITVFEQLQMHGKAEECGGLVYLNAGDWVESCTALVEDFAGNFSLIHFHENPVHGAGRGAGSHDPGPRRAPEPVPLGA